MNTNDRNTFPAAKEGGPVPGAPSCVFCSFLPRYPSGSLKLSFSVYPFPMNTKTKWNTKKEWNIKTKLNTRIKHIKEKTSCAGRIRLRATVARTVVAASRIMLRTAMASLFLLTAVLLYQIYMENHFQIYDSALRFHVRAASDGAEEQELKLKVRDEVLAVLRPAADRAESAGELKTEVEKMLPDIAQTAAKTLRENGSEDAVRVSVVQERFPARRYGKMFFPAGVYEALRVDIGAAQGHNWWCAIYPELCYNAEESSALSEKGGEDVEKDLSRKESQVLFGEKRRFRIRILEWFSELAS